MRAPQTEAFRRWFGNSVVRNADGSPRVVYHGTYAPAVFHTFRVTDGDIGIHFGTLEQAEIRLDTIAEFDFDASGTDEGFHPRIFPVYLSLQNPLRLPDRADWEPRTVAERLHDGKFQFPRMLREDQLRYVTEGTSSDDRRKRLVTLLHGTYGYDGIVYRNEYEDISRPADSYIVFSPTQIKSAIANRGTFDPTDPDILHGMRSVWPPWRN